MKRNEIVQSLLKEGLSEKTLVNFSDKQLNNLADRMLKEAQNVTTTKTVYDSKDPKDMVALNAALKNPDALKNQPAEVKEELKGDQKKLDKNHNGEIDSQDFKILKGQKKKESNKKDKKENIKEWVSKVTNKNFHSFTSKNEIMEMIQYKLGEQEVGSKVKKGHNGIPEFMSYEVISNIETIDAEPTTKPAPTKPKESPITKPRTPYSPKPGEKSKPKALKEKEVKNEVK